MTHTEVLDTTIPTNTDKEGLGAQRIRNGKRALRERMEVDHNFDDTGTSDDTSTSDGTHKKLTLDNGTTVAAGLANAGIIHSEDVNGIAEVLHMNENDDDVQITNGGDYAVPVRYAYASDATERTFVYNLSWVDDTNMDLTITVKDGDIVIVSFVGSAKGYHNLNPGNIINTAVQIVLESGSANEILASNVAGNESDDSTDDSNRTRYDGWACQAIYQATANGNLVFRNQIKSYSSDITATDIYIFGRTAHSIVIGQV